MNREQIEKRKAELAKELELLHAQEAMCKRVEDNQALKDTMSRLGKNACALRIVEVAVRKDVRTVLDTIPRLDLDFTSELMAYRRSVSGYLPDTGRAARNLVCSMLGEFQPTAWSPESWLHGVHFAKSFQARKDRIAKALGNVNTDRGDDSHGDLVDALALFLGDDFLEQLIKEPQLWKNAVRVQTEAYRISGTLMNTFGDDTWVAQNILNGENYFAMKLEDALLHYVGAIDWEPEND